MAEDNGVVIEVVTRDSLTTKAPAGNSDFMTGLLAFLDDENIRNEVTSKAYSSTKEVDVQQYLSLVEKILNQAMDFADDVAATTWAKGNQGNSTIPSIATYVPWSLNIDELYHQIKSLEYNNVHQTMESLFEQLSSFSWEAKAVKTLLALSVYYVEDWRWAEIQASDHLLLSLSRLRGLDTRRMPSKRQQIEAFVELGDLIRMTLAFTKCIVNYLSSSEDSGVKSPRINTSANFYDIIVIVLGCSVLFKDMISKTIEFRRQHLLTFSNMVRRKYQSFKEEVQNSEKEEEHRVYQAIEEVSNDCADIVELLKQIFCNKNDSLTLYRCSEKIMVKAKELKDRSVMLLISDLNLSKEDLATLTRIYNTSIFRNNKYEIMWFPIIEVHDEETQKQFLDMRSHMQWYTCTSIFSRAAANFIKKKEQFRLQTQQTKVVVLNQDGEEVNPDAMSLMRTFEWEAFPFTKSKGNDLWNTQGINWLELVLNKTIHPYIERHFETKELLFLYDSAEDSKTVHEIEEYLQKINGYMVSYRAIKIGDKRGQFLTRLENCISSKWQANPDVRDPVTQELLKLYTSYKKQGGFAIIARGSRVVVNACLTDFVTVLSQYQTWIKRVSQTQAFEAVFQEHYEQVIAKPRCHCFYIPSMVGNIKEAIKCTRCSGHMKITAVTLECCHGAH